MLIVFSEPQFPHLKMEIIPILKVFYGESIEWLLLRIDRASSLGGSSTFVLKIVCTGVGKTRSRLCL